MRGSRGIPRCLAPAIGATVAAALSFGGPSTAAASDVVTVPVNGAVANSSSAAIPHPAYNGHATTLKAIARGLPDLATAEAARFRWDTDADGSFADETDQELRQCVTGTPDGVSCYDLGQRVVLPQSLERQRLEIGIRLDVPGEEPRFGEYPVVIFPEAGTQTDPDDNATSPTMNASPAFQRRMGQVGAEDALWFAHLQMAARTGSGAAISGELRGLDGRPKALYTLPAADFLMLAERSGHLPAYPPDSYDHAVNPGSWWRSASPPAGFGAANDARYDADPYAETAMRALNGMVGQLAPVAGIPDADEGDDGRTPIPDTNDETGLTHTGGLTPFAGEALAALSGSGLAGTVAQTGDEGWVRGRPVEAIAQQLVDWLAYAQIDEASPSQGGWYYTANGSAHYGAELSRGVYLGLSWGDAALGSSGVIVNRRVRDRLANALKFGQDATTKLSLWANTGGSPCAGTGVFHATADALVAMGWLGWNNFSPTDTTVIAQDYAGTNITRGQARQIYDGYVNALASSWTTFQADCSGWVSGLFYNDGSLGSPHLRTDGLANIDALYAVSGGAGAVNPPPSTFGIHDWLREFTNYLVRNQAPDGSWMDADWPGGAVQRSRSYYGQPTTTLLGGLAITPPLSDPGPVAIAQASPRPATCGRPVSFDGSGSFHDSPRRLIVDHQWLFDVGVGWSPNWGGYDWASIPPDGYSADGKAARGVHRDYTYPQPGTYWAALRVFDDVVPTKQDAVMVGPILVNEEENEAPQAHAGGPYELPDGGSVELDASASSDANNPPCGPGLDSFAWDLDGDGEFDDAAGAQSTVTAAQLDALGIAHGMRTVSVRVSDTAGLSDDASAQLERRDTTAPDTSLDSGPAEGATTADDTPTFTFSSPDVSAGFECALDDGGFAPCASPHTTPALANGVHTFGVRAVDPAGNADPTPPSRVFTVKATAPGPVDLTPPETSIGKGPKKKTKRKRARFEFGANELASFECALDGGAWEPCTSPEKVKVKRGKHVFQVRATDAAGNVERSPASFKWKVKKKRK